MESGVLAKAFLVLEVLAGSDGPQALGAITNQLGLNKPTIHRILNDLAALGYVEQVGAGKYGLSGKLGRLAAGQDHGPLMSAAEPHLRTLHEKTGETVNLGVLRGTRVAYLRVIESTHPLRRVVEPGTLDPFHSTALGRAIVSHMPDATWSRLLRGVTLEARTPNTIVSTKKLRELLQEARENGYAAEREENDMGVMCLANPIRDEYGVVGAISITVPVARGTPAEAELRKHLAKASKAVERDLQA